MRSRAEVAQVGRQRLHSQVYWVCLFVCLFCSVLCCFNVSAITGSSFRETCAIQDLPPFAQLGRGLRERPDG